MSGLDAQRAARAAVTLTSMQVAAGTLAITGVFSRLIGSIAAGDFATSVAGTIKLNLALGAEVVVADIIRELLELRRKNWPHTVWGALADERIAAFAAEGAQKWERALREARAA